MRVYQQSGVLITVYEHFFQSRDQKISFKISMFACSCPWWKPCIVHAGDFCQNNGKTIHYHDSTLDSLACCMDSTLGSCHTPPHSADWRYVTLSYLFPKQETVCRLGNRLFPNSVTVSIWESLSKCHMLKRRKLRFPKATQV